jgi:hypothetical protein
MAAGSHFFGQIPSVYDFSPFRTVVDVGGGNGTLIAAILAANPGLQGIVFDSAQGARDARTNLDQRGCGDRVGVIAGDFFQEVPSGGDVYFFSERGRERTRSEYESLPRASGFTPGKLLPLSLDFHVLECLPVVTG